MADQADAFDPYDVFGSADPNEDRMVSHVLLFHGDDLAAAGIWEHDFAPCLLCAPLPPDREPCLVLSDEVLSWGRRIHFVTCGNCGTRGPWADRESDALTLWNQPERNPPWQPQ